MSWASPLCPGSPVCQDDNTSLFIWAGPARFAKPAHLTGITKNLVYMTSPLSRGQDEFLSTLTCTIMAFSSQKGGMACLYGKSSRLGNQDLAYNNWDLGKQASLAAHINLMVNFTQILGDAKTPSKAGCPGKPSWPGSYKQALNKPCVIVKVLHSFLSVLSLKSEKTLE